MIAPDARLVAVDDLPAVRRPVRLDVASGFREPGELRPVRENRVGLRGDGALTVSVRLEENLGAVGRPVGAAGVQRPRGDLMRLAGAACDDEQCLLVDWIRGVVDPGEDDARSVGRPGGLVIFGAGRCLELSDLVGIAAVCSHLPDAEDERSAGHVHQARVRDLAAVR